MGKDREDGPDTAETLPAGESAWGDAPALSGFDDDGFGVDTPRRPPAAALTGMDPDHPFETAETHRYQERAVLGFGGMGRVIAAADRRLLREVAFKEVGAGYRGVSSETHRRLAQEAWLTAQLEHPGIVPIYDAGRRPDGSLYYTMRLIQGSSLREALSGAAGLDARLGYLRQFLAVCDAMAYAHSRGVIHRDLKPDNIMVGEFGEAQVVDWGLARPVDRDAPEWRDRVIREHVSQTVAGAVIGTPRYMSPEQARGNPVDQRSDVWCLGAILYEIIAGEPPFEDVSSDEALETIDRGEIPRITTVGAPPELVAIAMRALAPDPGARYADAGALGQEIGRYMDGRRVRAHRYTLREQLARFVRSHRAAVTVAGVALVAIAVVFGVSYAETVRERDRAVAAEAETQEALGRAAQNLGAALIEQALVARAADARPEAEVLAARALAIDESPRARGVLAAFGLAARPRRLGTVETGPCRHRSLGAGGSIALCIGDGVLSAWDVVAGTERWRRPHDVREARWLDGSDRVVATAPGSRLLVLDARDGRLLHTLEGYIGVRDLDRTTRGRHFVQNMRQEFIIIDVLSMKHFDRARICGDDAIALAFGVSDDDTEMVTVCDDGRVVIGSVTGQPTRTLQLALESGGPPTNVVFTRDRRRLLVGNTRGRVTVLDALDGRVLRQEQLVDSAIRQLAVTPDGQLAAVLGDRGGPLLWDVGTGARRGRLPATAARSLAFEDRGRTLVTNGRRVIRWSLPDTHPPHVLSAPAGLSSATLSPDGEVVTLQRGDGAVSVVGTADGALLAELRWQQGVVKDGTFSPDGARFSAAGMGQPRPERFDTRTWRPLPRGDDASYLRALGELTGGWLVGISYGAGPHIQRSADGSKVAIGADGPFAELAVGAGGHVAVLRTVPPATLWRLRGGAAVPSAERLFEAPNAVAVDVSAGGETLVLGYADAVRLVAADTGEVLRPMAHPGGRIIDVAITADARWVAAGLLDGRVFVWRAADGALAAELEGHRQRISEVRFASDGATLLSASWDGTARRWALASLDRPAAALAAEIEDAWGLGLREAIDSRAR